MKFMSLFFAVVLTSTLTFGQDKIDQLTRRIEELERHQEEILLQSTQATHYVSSFFKNGLRFGGFFEPSYSIIQGPDTEFQAANASNILGINIAVEYSDNIHLVSQFLTGLTIPLQNQHNDPRSTIKKRQFSGVSFGAIVSQGYIDYTVSDKSGVQAGLGYVPFGHAAQQREMVLFIRRGGPQILRTTELFSPLWSGLHFYQHLSTSTGLWGYNFYSFTRLEDAKLPGVGGRTWWSSGADKVTIGFSAQVAKYQGHIEEILGTDINLHQGDFLLTSEYIRHVSEKRDDSWSFYVEPAFFIFKQELLFYAFFDYTENSYNKTSGVIADPYHKYEYGSGVNWLPTSYTRLRLGLTYHDYVHSFSRRLGQNRDYMSADLSAGIAF